VAPEWDVAVVGAGPAGLSAAYAAALAGRRTVVLERAAHPRYKTCGGGLIGTSLAAAARIAVPAADRVHAATFTHDGRREFTRYTEVALLTMVRREDFDDALRGAAVAAGAVVRERRAVRGLADNGAGVRVKLADGTAVTARVVIGADGSAGVTARHVGAEFAQVDLGLEVELPVPGPVGSRWAHRMLVDWGPVPGSYGWVFPKGDLLTVGVIAARGRGEETRRYLRRFLDRLGLAGIEPAHDSGHLTRCRSAGSPLRRGRVLVAGDAAGLLEPWTREGISFALRSGALAGEVAAAAVDAGAEDVLNEYAVRVGATLGAEMAAGRRLLAAFARRPAVFHRALSTPPGWRTFARFCRGERPLSAAVGNPAARAALALLGTGRSG
jgi:geranylgeranyl reductase family protein